MTACYEFDRREQWERDQKARYKELREQFPDVQATLESNGYEHSIYEVIFPVEADVTENDAALIACQGPCFLGYASVMAPRLPPYGANVFTIKVYND